MMCYKDMTFCDFDLCEKFKNCKRAFSSSVKAKAGNWWKAGGGKPDEAPVCFFTEKPDCFILGGRL